jgi:FAD/FMN-containing dehydrogenase
MIRTHDFSGLAGAVDGRLRLPAEPGFASASRPFNERFLGTWPAAVLSAGGPRDVVRAIHWAREKDVPLVARGGGHGYAGGSVTTGLVLDLRALDEVRVDRSTGLVTVGGGTRMGPLYSALRRHDLAFPLGNSDDVGIGGLVLGGGVAAVSRRFGLTCDSLVATDIVLADGTRHTCDENHDADLFWAARGGGGGNFGVHTSFTFQAQPVRPSSTCLLLWPREHAETVLRETQRVLRDAPDEFAARIGVSRAAGRDATVSVLGWHLGPATELRELLAPVLALARPDRAEIVDRTYWQAKDFLHHNTAGGAFAVRTRCTPKPLAEDGVRALLAAVDQWPGSGNPDGAGVALFTWGGEINRVPVTATAFPHRDTLFLVSLDTSWSATDSAEVVAANLDWLAALHQELAEFTGDGAYLNFADPDLADWPTAYHGPNLARLAEIKRRHDPDRFFRFDQAI